MEELRDYVKLLDLGQPDFIEIKGAIQLRAAVALLVIFQRYCVQGLSIPFNANVTHSADHGQQGP